MTTAAATQHENVYEALAAARREFPNIERNSNGQVGTRRYKYADLNTVVEAVKPILEKHGLMVIQNVLPSHLETTLRLVAKPAEFIYSGTALPDGSDPQKLGSAITYARRYALVAMLGLLTEDDDDGDSASHPPARGSESGAQPPASPAPPAFDATAHGWDSEEQAKSAHAALGARISALAEPNPNGWQACIDWRQAHSWPVGVEDFAELEEVVRLAEGFAPTA